ncbi:MAG: 2-oxoacid:acceptor oxidoreductase family protein [Thermodesulforhabdaceae bacterium]|jgi:indolepyruvate ferredoxin oxidoreductase beta subunit
MKQQIVISGFGGQGVVFITRLITEAALYKGLSVFASETHGMAQRGGNVVSHIKIYEDRDGAEKFWSPVIRSGNADLLIALHPESIAPYRHLLKPGGLIICNGSPSGVSEGNTIMFDANSVAMRMGNPRMANIVLLGFAASGGYLFCSVADLIDMISKEAGSNGFIEALKMGAS